MNTVFSFVLAHPVMVYMAVSGVLTFGYQMLGQSSNPRLHAFFELLAAMGFDPKQAAKSVVTMVTGRAPQ